MTTAAHRVLSVLTESRLAGLVLSRLPGPVAETLRSLGEDLGERGQPSDEVRRGAVDDKLRAAAFVLGDVLEGGSVRAVNVVKGNVVGGSLRAVNLVIGDVTGGELRAVNVVIGDVRGGSLSDVHLIVGNVSGGELTRCYAVIGDVSGGRGRVSRVLGRHEAPELECEKCITPNGDQ